jgi:hypothetical protein
MIEFVDIDSDVDAPRRATATQLPPTPAPGSTAVTSDVPSDHGRAGPRSPSANSGWSFWADLER